MLISDLSSDVCSSDLKKNQSLIRLRKLSQQFWPLLSGFRSWPNSILRLKRVVLNERPKPRFFVTGGRRLLFNLRHIASRMGWTANDPDRSHRPRALPFRGEPRKHRSEEHTSELQSLMRISYAVFCLKKKNKKKTI